MKNKIILLSLLLSFFLFTNDSFAQDSREDENVRNFGLTATVQSAQFDILVPIWISPRTVIGPGVSFVSVQDSGSDLGFGAFSKFYFSIEKIAPYFGLRAGAVWGMPNEGDTVTDIIAGLSFGGDYFPDEQFSLGVEIQGNFTFSDEGSMRFGNPGGINFNTASLITASIYF